MRARVESGILAVMLAFAWPALCLASPATPALIAEVQTALDRGDALHAANLAEGAMREQDISPAERARLLLYHGLAEELLGINDAATRDFTAALNSRALPPEERVQALLQRGFLRDGEGRLNEAASDYSAVITLNGDGVATALNNRANIYRRQNLFAEAKRDYQAALTAGGKPQYAWYGLGRIAESEGDTLVARGFYAKAVATDSAYVLAAERLTALGGPPEGAIANPKTPILLKSPARAAAAPFTAAPPAQPAPARVATAAPPADAPIVLRPPSPKSPAPARPPSPTRPAQTADILRPSMDQTAAAKGEVQLGAWRSEAEAKAGWEKARARAPDLFAGLKPHVMVADLPGRGRYYRLRVSPAPGASRSAFCDELTAKGVACFPARD
jgi:tetratricopeptide (TPR) repeat protein